MRDVTDSTFEEDVLERSDKVPVVVDLWAPWCGPCRTLGPMIEHAVEDTGGAVELVKVNVDENPVIASAFKVQSIPAVFALRERQVVDTFIGAIPEAAVKEFVSRLAPGTTEVGRLIDSGDEESLRRALDMEPANPGAVLKLAELLVGRGDDEEALDLLARVPETAEVRRVAALARLGPSAPSPEGPGLEQRLDSLLERVRDDEEARQEFLDLLETMGPDDQRTLSYRRALTSRLY